MRKTFIKVALFSLVAAVGSVSLVGCKDYDDDITNINGTTGDLSAQIKNLKEQATALDTAAKSAQSSADQANAAAKAAAEAAATADRKGDAAEASAQKAMSEAQAAKAAAEQAKADALAELAKQAADQAEKYNALESLINQTASAGAANAGDIADLKSKIQTVVTDIAALQGAVSAIDSKIALTETELGKLTTDVTGLLAKVGAHDQDIAALQADLQAVNGTLSALQQFKTATEIQLAALENFKNQTTADISGLQGKITAAETELTTIKSNITAIESEISSMAGDISALQQALPGINSDITGIKSDITALNQSVTEIASELSTLSGILNGRLSSVTFVPSAYVDGIPSIDFSSIRYIPMVKSAKGNWEANTSANATPSYVASSDIKAEYRLNPSSVVLSDIDASGISFVDRVATSRAAATSSPLIKVADNGASINDGILSLNVVKTGNDLFELPDGKINIVALKVPIAKKHLFEGETEASVYSEYVRLTEYMLTPQIGRTGKNVAAKQFNDSTEVYDNATGVTAITNGYMDELDLFKYVNAVLLRDGEWYESLNAEQMQSYGLAVKFHIAKAAYNVNGVNQQLYGKIDGSTFSYNLPAGLSSQSLIGKTPIVAATLVDTKNGKVIDQRYLKIELTADKSNQNCEYPAFSSDLFCGTKTFKISWSDFVSNVLDQIGNPDHLSKTEFVDIYVNNSITVTYQGIAAGEPEEGVNPTFVTADANALTWDVTAEQIGEVPANAPKSIKATVKFVDESDLRGDITLTLTLNVTTGASQIPTLGTTDNLLWVDGLMKIYPTNPASSTTGKAEYYTNILKGRNKPYVNNLMGCASYYMTLDVDANSPASLEFPAGFDTPYSITGANQATLGDVFFKIENNDAGIALVESETIVNMDWSAYLNGEAAGNLAKFGISKFQILKPLYLETVNSSNALIDNSLPQTVSLGGYYTISDAYGNKVFNGGATNQTLYDFYGIEDVEFGPDSDIKIADNIEGTENVRTPESIDLKITVTSAGELTFYNDGAVLQSDGFIIVPVSVKHLWGTLKGSVAVPLKKKL